MIQIVKTYNEYLQDFNKKQLVEIVREYHSLCKINSALINEKIEKKKKKDIITYLEENLRNYITYLVKMLDTTDFSLLNTIINRPRKVTDAFLVDHRIFINYLIDKKILNQKENLEICRDVIYEIRLCLNNKDIIKQIKKQDKMYKIADGIIIAYGVVTKEFFEQKIGKDNIETIKKYYKKEYTIKEKEVVSLKLTNPKRIEKYLKNTKMKEFTEKDLFALGTLNYHRNCKSYKKLIKVLKSNYVFKNSDIIYLDKVVVVPYLYNSINEEDLANKTLEETIMKLFEFKNDKLKTKMLEEIKALRNEFPIWEYRGFTKDEVK